MGVWGSSSPRGINSGPRAAFSWQSGCSGGSKVASFTSLAPRWGQLEAELGWAPLRVVSEPLHMVSLEGYLNFLYGSSQFQKTSKQKLPALFKI